MDYPQIVTTITEGLAPISSIVDAPWVSVTSLNGMTGDVIVEPIIKPFQSNHYYLKDSVITHDGAICIAKQTFTSGESFNPDDWNIPDFTQEQADWNEDDSTAKSYIKNKPTIPVVNNGTLTIQSNGINIASFSANSATDTTANILVPTETSVLINNGSDGTSVYVEEDELAPVAISGDYNDLSNLPTPAIVNDGTLIIQQNGITVDTFTANSATNKTVNIETITAETVAPAEEVGAITASMIDWSTFGNQTSYFDIGNIRVAFGSAILTGIASGAESPKSVSFGVSFNSAPIVTFTVASWVPVVFQVISSVSTSSFGAIVKHNFGSTLDITINWIAIGAKA